MKIPKELISSIEAKAVIGNYKYQDNIATAPVNVRNNNPSFATSQLEQDVFKAFIPWFIYKPPYGFPRETNPLILRQFAKNAYIFSVIKTLQDLISSHKFDIQLKEEYIEQGHKEDIEVKKQILKFFNDPNGNDESFEHLIRCWVKDVCEVGNFVGVKVFNKQGQFSQLFARDASTFLKNPDVYGYMGNRDDFVKPVTQYVSTEGLSPAQGQSNLQDNIDKMGKANFDKLYKDSAAYFQYGWTAGARPVPFGKREIVWGGLTPRTDSIYEQSPIEILYNQILTLVYGAEYNLDFYLNNNLPTGILTLQGASPDQAKTMRSQMETQFMTNDEFGNYKKKHFKIPISGYEAKFTQLQMSSKEMEVIEQQKWFTRLVWGVFGVTSDDMGIIEDSNKAISENQSNVTKRKAIKPFLRMFEYIINIQIMPEFNHPEYEFKFEDYDLEEDRKKHELWQMQINMGIRTPEDIATQELGISKEDFDKTRQEQDTETEEEHPEHSEDTNDDLFNSLFTKSEKLTEMEKLTIQMLNKLKGLVLTEFKIDKLAEIKGYVDYKAITADNLDKYKEYFNNQEYKQKLTDIAYKEFEKGIEEIEKKLNRNIVVTTQDLSNLNEFLINNIKDLNDELINDLRQQITLGLINKEPINSINKRIKQVFELSENRAKTILRTELNRIYGAGSYQAALNSGVEFYKYVNVHIDKRTSKICKDLNRDYGSPEQAIPMNQKFKLSNGQEELVNPFHVNCRTVVVYLPKDEVKKKEINNN